MNHSGLATPFFVMRKTTRSFRCLLVPLHPVDMYYISVDMYYILDIVDVRWRRRSLVYSLRLLLSGGWSLISIAFKSTPTSKGFCVCFDSGFDRLDRAGRSIASYGGDSIYLEFWKTPCRPASPPGSRRSLRLLGYNSWILIISRCRYVD